MFETLKKRFEQGRITVAMLKVYVKKGVITQEQFNNITNNEK